MKTCLLPPAQPGRRLWPAVVGAATLALAACAPAPDLPKAAATAPSGGWREFAGSWNAVGTRRTIDLGPGRKASIIGLQGSLLLQGEGRPGVGFHSEVVALADSATGLTGRAVWTDERGDQVYSELQGEGTAERNRVHGTVVGGSGRFAGAAGTYEFSWQYMLEAEDGPVQGRAVDLKGRVRLGTASVEGSPR